MRERQGLTHVEYAHTGMKTTERPVISKAAHRSQYNRDGTVLAYYISTELLVINVDVDGKESEKCVINLDALDFELSPSGRYLSVFTSPPSGNLTTGEAAPNTPNLFVYDISHASRRVSPREVASFQHRQQNTWSIQWTNDENVFARLVGNEVRFYRCDDTSKGKGRY